MLHAITLGLFIVLVVSDALGEAGEPPPVLAVSTWMVVAGTLGPLALLWTLVHVVAVRAGLALDRAGSIRPLRLILRSLTLARLATLVLFAFAVIGLGWLGLVRTTIGDLVLLDEAVALLPPVATIVGLWWSYYPIERRLREATVLAALDSGRAVPGLPTRGQYVLDQSRLHLLLVLLPLFALTVWWESLDRFLTWAGPAGYLPEAAWFGEALVVVQYAGVLVILALMPLVLIRAWSTVRLGEGALRDRLEALCRVNRVRVRALLVWRTHNAMVNGALIGIVPPFRYILLTDALLASLPLRQVEAVMAHEVAHARRHHLPWLVVILIATGGLTWFVAALAYQRVLAPGAPPSMLGEGLLTLITLAVTVMMFGHVSRRFEEQADAFATQHLSREDTPEAEPVVVTEAAAGAMSGALANVAILNHIDPKSFSFRHGSITARRRRLHAAVGQPIGRLSVDRKVRRLKVAGLLGLLILIVLTSFAP